LVDRYALFDLHAGTRFELLSLGLGQTLFHAHLFFDHPTLAREFRSSYGLPENELMLQGQKILKYAVIKSGYAVLMGPAPLIGNIVCGIRGVRVTPTVLVFVIVDASHHETFDAQKWFEKFCIQCAFTHRAAKRVFGSRGPFLEARRMDAGGTFALAATTRHGQKGDIVVQTYVCVSQAHRNIIISAKWARMLDGYNP
jgi:hypothetical protein